MTTPIAVAQQPLRQHQRQDRPRVRAERLPDPELANALRHAVREHAVDPDRRHQQRDRAEDRQQRHRRAAPFERAIHPLLHRPDVEDRLLGIDLLHGRSHLRDELRRLDARP